MIGHCASSSVRWGVRLVRHAARYYAREIQRLYRGHLARRRTRLCIEQRAAVAVLSIKHAAATPVRRVFRGHLSRRLRHDFHARKAYISAVHAQGEALRAQLQAQFEEQTRVSPRRTCTHAVASRHHPEPSPFCPLRRCSSTQRPKRRARAKSSCASRGRCTTSCPRAPSQASSTRRFRAAAAAAAAAPHTHHPSPPRSPAARCRAPQPPPPLRSPPPRQRWTARRSRSTCARARCGCCARRATPSPACSGGHAPVRGRGHGGGRDVPDTLNLRRARGRARRPGPGLRLWGPRLARDAAAGRALRCAGGGRAPGAAPGRPVSHRPLAALPRRRRGGAAAADLPRRARLPALRLRDRHDAPHAGPRRHARQRGAGASARPPSLRARARRRSLRTRSAPRSRWRQRCWPRTQRRRRRGAAAAGGAPWEVPPRASLWRRAWRPRRRAAAAPRARAWGAARGSPTMPRPPQPSTLLLPQRHAGGSSSGQAASPTWLGGSSAGLSPSDSAAAGGGGAAVWASMSGEQGLQLRTVATAVARGASELGLQQQHAASGPGRAPPRSLSGPRQPPRAPAPRVVAAARRGATAGSSGSSSSSAAPPPQRSVLALAARGGGWRSP